MASRSPRRQEAAAALGLAFDMVVSDAEARLPPPPDPSDPVPAAVAKALDVACHHPAAVVLAGDTIVALERQALGKPATPEQAHTMLWALRGREHRVRTALALASGAELAASEVSCRLVMRRYTDGEVDHYVASGEPLDCAGAYDVHRQGSALVAQLDGCISAVVGMPLVEAAQLLARAGIPVPRDPAAVCTRLYGRRCLALEPAAGAACRGAGSRIIG